jgi:methionyl aminopeptidase
MSIGGPEDLAALQRVGKVVACAREAMLKEVRPGVSTAELDEVARAVLQTAGARSAPQLAYKFPGWTCISINDELAHGIPSARRVLAEGDLVNVDVSAELDGYWADTGASIGVGEISPKHQRLLETTRTAQQQAMHKARAGARLSEIGRTVEHHTRGTGFRVVRNIGGHGVGRFIHEDPHVSNVYDPRDRRLLQEGQVIAIEPFLTTRATVVVQANDGWTLRTPDGSFGAQFEHTIVVTNGEPIVLTAA